MKGFVSIIKPKGLSSSAVVSKVKKKLGVPCGHMGTLDPMAEGVLPVGVGKTSRLFNYLLDKVKVYVAEFTFGYLTDTLDSDGKVIATTDSIPSLDSIKEAVKQNIGTISQVPPDYSAKCINGKRGYQLARSGVEFKLEPKLVTVDDINILGFDNKVLKLKITCRGGTYVRSICRDIASYCNTLATMTKLTRTKSGAFDLKNSVLLEDFINEQDPVKFLLPSDIAVQFNIITLDDNMYKRLLNGLKDEYDLADGIYKLYRKDEFIGLGEVVNRVLKLKAYIG